MKQTVIVAEPPVYDRCVTVFGETAIVGKPILWSWGDKIYNPLDTDIPRELFAHEAVHGQRQLGQIDTWWDKYLSDPIYRFEEEVLAHRAEWQRYIKTRAGEDCSGALEAMAGRLASPLYGKLVTLDGARAAILAR